VTTAATPYPRGARRSRSNARRLTSWIRASAWLLLVIGGVCGIAFLLFIHRGDAEGSARIANREIELLLDRGERVEQRLPVMQRYWWDYFRVTHGVLAVTDRRILFVGVPPDDLVPHEGEPLELLEFSIPYDHAQEHQFTRAFLGTRPAIAIRDAEGTHLFAYASIDRERAQGVMTIVDRKEEELRSAALAERRATDAAAAASRRAIYHLVQRGEALEVIAKRYGVPMDSIIKWNNLSGSRITAGRRLLVKPGT
jgi:hypothetical protein